MNRGTGPIILACWLAFQPAGMAEEICQQQDERGLITFTDCDAITEGATKIDLGEPNRSAPVKALPTSRPKQRVNKIDKRKQLDQALQALEEAKQVREGDRQKTKTGSRLTAEYFRRVEQAQKRVDALQ